MREYEVRIRETLEKTVTVEAHSPQQAREIVERNWKNSDYVLDASCFTNVAFSVPARNVRER